MCLCLITGIGTIFRTAIHIMNTGKLILAQAMKPLTAAIMIWSSYPYQRFSWRSKTLVASPTTALAIEVTTPYPLSTSALSCPPPTAKKCYYTYTVNHVSCDIVNLQSQSKVSSSYLCKVFDTQISSQRLWSEGYGVICSPLLGLTFSVDGRYKNVLQKYR